ncbi:MAG: cytochrome bc complex cytochrome b subunit [Microlunatus sp.]|nr:cytochrome bc complex cytochrome b subunit [Microlunatus sp.]
MPVNRRRQLARSSAADHRRSDPSLLHQSMVALSTRRVHLTWTSLFGVVTVTCLVILAITGILLAFPYRPSGLSVTYHGVYTPLTGVTVSEAYDSVMKISLELPGGLLIRQTHHWAALVLPASLIVQLLSTFFSGGFRRPRRIAWLLLVGLFVIALLGGWSGYALPNDMLAGTGLRIFQGTMLAIPFVGTQLAVWLFGGGFPGQIIEHLYPVHVLLVPGAAAVALAARLVHAWRHGPTIPANAAATGSIGIRMWPDAAMKAFSMGAMTTAVLVMLGTVATISPVWLYGPADPAMVSAGSQPDWYIGFVDGALRLAPPGWETRWFGYTWTFAILVPLLVVGGWFIALTLYPYLESWVTGDRLDHDVRERPRNVPVRTGIGVAGALFYGVLWAAAGSDIIATTFHLSFEAIVRVLRITLIVGPLLAFEITRRIALGMQRADRDIVLHGRETGQLTRTPEGGYVELHQSVADAELPALAVEPVEAVRIRPDRDGRLTARTRLRGYLGRHFVEGYVHPVEAPEHEALSSDRPSTEERHPAEASETHQ